MTPTPRRRFHPQSCPRAVVHAANLGVECDPNISEAACYKGEQADRETSLGASIDYAVNQRRGGGGRGSNTSGDCVQNPAPDPSTPGDPRGWNNVQTVVTRRGYAPLVLSVGIQSWLVLDADRGWTWPRPQKTSSRSATPVNQ